MAARTPRTSDPVLARVARAKKALAEGAYTIRRDGFQGSMYRWTLENGGKTYTIEYNRETKSFACTCPDFQNRGAKVGTCKHIEAVKIWERQRRAHTNGNGKTDAPQEAPTAPEKPAPLDLRAAANFAVAVLETAPNAVNSDGDAWVLRIPPRLNGGEDEVRVTRRNGKWACSVCGTGECKHAVVVQVFHTWRSLGLPAPLPAARAFLNARRNGQTLTSEPPAKPPAKPPAEPPVVGGRGGDAELIRALNDIAEQLRAIEAAIKHGLEDIAVTIETIRKEVTR